MNTIQLLHKASQVVDELARRSPSTPAELAKAVSEPRSTIYRITAGLEQAELIRSNGEGDNLFLSSILALKPDTGEYVWHFQSTPAESWDYTATQPLLLADLTLNGQPRKVVMQAPKNGFFYVLDRVTGESTVVEPPTANQGARRVWSDRRGRIWVSEWTSGNL